jgi:tetratricopeptide (TPR) repeat protein
MSLLFSQIGGVRPGLAVLLSGVLLSVVLPDLAFAGQDLRYLSFHPVRLTPNAAQNETGAATAAAPTADYVLHPTLPDPSVQEVEYRQVIANMQRTQGEFALPLAEQLLGLGHALQEQGRLDEALKNYEASRHVMRVNLGLNSLEQAPVLTAMFSVYAAQGDIENAHTTQEALFNLRVRHHGGQDSPEAVNALLDWADWNVTLYMLLDPRPSPEASVLPYSRFSDPRLELAYNTYTSALQTLQQHAQPGDIRLVMTERKLAALNFITDQKLQDTYGIAAPSYSTASTEQFDPAGDARANASTARFYDGDSALRRAIAHSARQPERRNAEVAARMVELGDWYLLFDRRAAALDLYRDALQFMRANSLPQEDVERIMSSGMPVPTPDAAYLAPTDAREFDGFLDVEFELTQFGMATHPRVIASSTDDRRIERELLREIRDCKFRPKFVADSPVKGEKIQLRYYYSL